MIRKFSIFSKLVRMKTSSAALFHAYMENFKVGQEECPVCHIKGCCRRYAEYHRYMLDFTHEKTTTYTLSIVRVKCENCNHTHAILPDFIVPYREYSLIFILKVLMEYFLHTKPVTALCEKYQITPSMLYRWKTLFFLHHFLWMQCLEDSLKLYPASFLKEILCDSCWPNFLSDFFLSFEISFLQSHANSIISN